MGAVPSPAQSRNLSVKKAAAVLRAAASDRDGATVSELARRAGLPRATALRMVEALIAEGLLWRLPSELLVPGPGLFALATAADPNAVLLDAAESALAALVAEVRETVTLTVSRTDGSLAIVRQLDGPHMVGLTNWVGRPFALHASSSGKLALALGEAAVRRRLPTTLQRHASRTIIDPALLEVELQQIREQGYAEIVDELEDGLAALSVPITFAGALVASVNISGPSGRFDAVQRARALPLARSGADDVEHRLDPAGGH